MGIGSTIAVQEAEDEFREKCAHLIAQKAAGLVAAGDMGRKEAIQKIAEWIRQEGEAEGDETGTLSIENVFPSPSKVAPPNQVAAITFELLEAAREAADTL